MLLVAKAESQLIDELRDEFVEGKVLFVVGAGVSILATDGVPAASWKGLLRHGVQKLLALGRCSKQTCARITEQIDSDDLLEMLGAATFVSQKLGGPEDGEFRTWLRETVGALAATNPPVIEALAGTGAIILTTNYDSLIEHVTGQSPVTWRESDRCERILRGSERAVIHIHGHWESPETVILGQDAYAIIGRDERVQSFIRAAYLAKTFVYVGYGDGLSDPNFAQFLQWSERYFSESQTRRYRLVRERDVTAVRHQHPQKQRIHVLSYGSEYADLTTFLQRFRPHRKVVANQPAKPGSRALLPNIPPDPRFELRGIDWYEERDAAFLHGRDGDIDHIKQLLAAYPVVRLVAPSGTGKSSLLRAGVVPALRKLGWRAAVVRPYDDPANTMAGEITHALLTRDSQPFRHPVDTYAMRQQLSPLLNLEACPCLVLIIDQVEDILSPSAPLDAKAWLRDILREIYRCAEVTPYLKAVISYRTEAEAQLGRVWQEASGNPAGFPYHLLLGITIEDTEVVIAEVAKRLEWTLEIGPRELASELRVESRTIVQDTFVFPPYLQILLASIAAEGIRPVVDVAFIQRLGGVTGIIATYLRRIVDEVENKGGDYQYVRRVLQAVCRSSGEKLRQTTAEIAEYAALPEPVVRILLEELVGKRLVRPLGGDSHEILHDRLAEVIIAELEPGQRESKQAIELLLSKSASFDATRALLTEGEMELLFKHRAKLPSRPTTDRLLITSMLQVYQQRSLPPVGWNWLRSKKLEDVLERLIDPRFGVRGAVRKALNRALAASDTEDLEFLVRVAGQNLANLRDGALAAVERFGGRGDTEGLRRLLRHESEKVRRAAALALISEKGQQTLKTLRGLAIDDPDYGVRRAAMESLREVLTTADAAALKLIATRNTGEQAKRAVGILAEAENPHSLNALASLVHNTRVRALAARFLLRKPEQAPAVTTQILATDDWRLKAVLAEESVSFDVLRSLASEKSESVRKAAFLSIGLLGTADAHEWLTAVFANAQITSQRAILEAIAAGGHSQAFEFLRDIAESDSSVANAALHSIASLGTTDAVNYLLDQSVRWQPAANDDTDDEAPNDHDESYNPWDSADSEEDGDPPTNPFHPYVVAAIKAINNPELLPELRGWSESPVAEISAVAIESYTRLSQGQNRAWMINLLEKSSDRVRQAILNALTGSVLEDATPILKAFGLVNYILADHAYSRGALEGFILHQTDKRSLPALRQLSANGRGFVRVCSVQALARLKDPTDLPLLIVLARKSKDEARIAAIKSLRYFREPEARKTLRDIAVGASSYRVDAAKEFCGIASNAEKAQLLEECVVQGKFDVAGVVDFHLSAPSWWPQD